MSPVRGDLDLIPTAVIADGDEVYVGDVIATRRNQRQLRTSDGYIVCNRDLWTVTGVSEHGDLTVTHNDGHGTVTFPAGYARDHVRLGYAATEPGNQSDTETASITLATPATTARGLYVAMTRGQQENVVLVVTDGHDLDEARDVLETILATDRADVPATTQRRELAQQDRQPALQPRCVIPDWFDELRDAAAAKFADAADALERSEAKRAQLEQAIIAAQERLAAANQACGLYDSVVDAARGAVAVDTETHAPPTSASPVPVCVIAGSDAPTSLPPPTVSNSPNTTSPTLTNRRDQPNRERAHAQHDKPHADLHNPHLTPREACSTCA